MNIGDTFVWCPPGTAIDHLWILISEPNQYGGRCVLVNLTESLHGKYSFVLKPGQHRWIYKDSDVNFGDAFLTSVEYLSAQIEIRAAVPHDPMDPAILSSIIKAAHSHPAFQPILRRFLRPL